MGLFRRHKFRVSPLSLAVPLDGSETVTGLRELQVQQDGHNLARALHIDQSLQGAKKRRQRYKGPYLNQLAPDDFRRAPVPWISFLLGGSVWHIYNVPEHTDHLCERTEENIMTYLANYVRMAFLLAALVLLMRPWAILGLFSAWVLVSYKLNVKATPQERALPFLERVQRRFMEAITADQRQQQGQVLQQQQQQQQRQGGTRGDGEAANDAESAARRDAGLEAWDPFLTLICYVLVIYTNLLGAVIRWVLLTTVVILTHAALRRTPSELAAVLLTTSPSQPATVVQPKGPGVPFVEVLGLRTGHEDPRRVFREAIGFGSSIAAAAGIYCKHACQHYWHKTWMRVPSYPRRYRYRQA